MSLSILIFFCALLKNRQEKSDNIIWRIFDDVFLDYWHIIIDDNARWTYRMKTYFIELSFAKYVQLITNLQIKIKINRCVVGVEQSSLMAKLYYILRFYG